MAEFCRGLINKDFLFRKRIKRIAKYRPAMVPKPAILLPIKSLKSIPKKKLKATIKRRKKPANMKAPMSLAKASELCSAIFNLYKSNLASI